MAFQQASAPVRVRAGVSLSADNARPDRFALIDALRRAAPALPFGPPVIATIDALLSCLPPKRTHDLVFASNATLVLRRNGISDRTLRRHLADLIEAGFMRRVDSPNGKRYSRRDPEMGTVLRFGLDLSPLFDAFSHIQALAHQQTLAAARIGYLRSKLRHAIAHVTNSAGGNAILNEAARALRRKLSVLELEDWLRRLHEIAVDTTTIEAVAEPAEMSASNGQNVRHHQKSLKEPIEEKARPAEDDTTASGGISLETLAAACPQAAAFLPDTLHSDRDVIAHARRLAPMIGIGAECYDAAEASHGRFGAALTIWAMLEMLDRIQQPGAYFRSITSGPRAPTFDPWRVIRRLVARSQNRAQDCPRTTPTSGHDALVAPA